MEKRFKLSNNDIDFNPKDYWLAGWSYPSIKSSDCIKRRKLFKYEISGKHENGSDFNYSGIVEAEDVETARNLIETPKIRSGMTKLWSIIYKI
jgi:hypothetical protein